MSTLILDATTKTIKAVMSGAASTTNPTFTSHYADNNGTTFTEGSSDGAFNGTTDVTLVSAPSSGYRRTIKDLTIYNADSASVTISIKYDNNGTQRTIAKVTLLAGERWTPEVSFDEYGKIKTQVGTGSGGTPGGSDTQVQFNDGGSFGGDAGLTYNKTTDTLSAVAINATGNVTLSGGTANGVLYLNGSKVATSGSAVTYNGTTFSTSADASVNGITVGRGAGAVATNTAVGASALAANTSGAQNTIVGNQAGATTNAAYLTAVGYQAARYNTGDGNTAIGTNALLVASGANGTGTNNVAVGKDSLYNNTTASNNTAVGYQAGYSNTTAAGITALGYRAAYSVVGGGADLLTAVGIEAAYSTTTGASITAVGRRSLYSNTTGGENTATGINALYFNTTGSYNTALGSAALQSNTTASNNTAVGYQAGYSNTTASNNTAVGYQALYNVLPATISVASGSGTLTNGVEYTITVLGTVNWTTIGAASPAAVGNKFTYNNATITGSGGSVTQNVNAKNVAIGYQAGDVITTGTGNVIIGGGADPSVNSATDQIVIGNGVTGQADTNVTIGNGAGKIYNAYTVNATWTQTSDGTMKNVIGPDSLGLSFINRLNPILFTWKAQNDLPPDHPYYAEENKRDTTRVIHGFVAQEVKAALDAEGCSTFNGWDQGDDGIQAISREMFISPLVKAVQELSAQVEQLKAELAALKGA